MQNLPRPDATYQNPLGLGAPLARTPEEAAFEFPLSFYLGTAILCVLALLTPNPVLSVACIAVLVLIVRLLWRPGEAPAIVLAIGIQWTQVAAKVVEANTEGSSVAQMSLSPNLEVAIWIGLASITALSIGIWLVVRRLPLMSLKALDQQLQLLSISKVFLLYLCLAAYWLLLPRVIWRLLSLAQLLLFIGSLKWAAYYLLGYLVLRRRRRISYLVIATVLEVVTGIGYFSDFKTVFFFAALIFFSLHFRLKAKTTMMVSLIAAVLIFLSLVWISIKHEYRDYLNQGTNQQVVLVSPSERLTAFAGMARELTLSDLATNSKTLFMRIAYVDFFAASMDYVPRVRQHTNGALFWRAMVHILVPRLLYPSKPVLASDSDLTMEFTGLTMAGGDTGTSISLGYVAENYIDFGRYLLLAPIFIIGLAWGAMYSYCIKRGREVGVGHAFGTVIIMGASQFEVTEVKLLGGMLMSILVYALVLRFVMPALALWLREESPVRSAASADSLGLAR
jgi:hypothetical protein